MKFDRDKTKPEPRDDSEPSELDAARLLIPRPQVERISAHVLRRLMPQSSPASSNIAFRARASRLFAQELAVRRRRSQGADSAGFVSSHFGDRFGLVQGRALTDARVYKEPGRFFRNRSFKSITELFMSFTSLQLVQDLRIFLNQISAQNHIRTQQSFNSSAYLNVNNLIRPPAASRAGIHATVLSTRLLTSSLSPQPTQLAERSTAVRSAREKPLSSALLAGSNRIAQIARRRIERQRTNQATAHYTIDRVLTQTRLHQKSLIAQIERQRIERQRIDHLTTAHYTIDRVLTQTRSHNESLIAQIERQKIERQRIDHLTTAHYTIDRLLTQTRSHQESLALSEARLDHWTTLKQKVADVMGRTLSNFSPVSDPARISPPRKDNVNAAWRVPSLTGRLLLIDRLRQQHDKSESFHTWERDPSAQAFLTFTRLFNMHGARRIVTTLRFDQSKSEFMTVASSLNRNALLMRQSVLGTLPKHSQSLAERSRETKVFETKLRKRFAAPRRTVEKARSSQVSSEISLLRREGNATGLPEQFVFAQPARQEIPAERVVKRVEAREVVEIVKKEVSQSLASVASLRIFTRQDYEEISDQVYSSLVRRLTVERERLGIG